MRKNLEYYKLSPVQYQKMLENSHKDSAKFWSDVENIWFLN